MRRGSLAITATMVALVLGGCGSKNTVDPPSGGERTGVAMELRSSAFPADGRIPKIHTCESEDLSPPLAWSGAPASTRSFVLIVDDPDAPDPRNPQTVWVHWVLYDLPSDTIELPQGLDSATLPEGARAGRNDFGKTEWGGPCPPIGEHRYFFELYALDTTLGDLGPATKQQVEARMEGHIVGSAELIGRYSKEGR